MVKSSHFVFSTALFITSPSHRCYRTVQQSEMKASTTEAASGVVVHILAVGRSAASNLFCSLNQSLKSSSKKITLMASSMSTATSSYPRRMCACGFGHYVVMISRSVKNSGRAYYVCPRPTMNNRCAKFKTKPLQHLDLMERVYSDTAATGKHAWTPIEIYNENVDAANTIAYSGMEPLSAGTPPHPRHDTVGENVVDSSLFDNASLYSNVDESTNAKCRKQPGPVLWQVA